MSGLVDAPWSDGAAAPPQDEDLAARIGAMSIRDLKGFLAERRVTPDATIIEKAELRALAYAAAGVAPPEPPLPPGWARYESDGRASLSPAPSDARRRRSARGGT